MTQREDMPVLIAQTGPMAGQRWALVKDQLLIGRGSDCDVVVDDRQISRHHARVKRTVEGYLLEDLASKNGTHLNGTFVLGAARLQDGDVIQVALALRLAFVGSEATLPLGSLGLPREPGEGLLRLDALSRRVWVGKQEVDPPLSVPQYRLLEMLYNNAGKVCSREQVVRIVWPEAAGAGVSEQAIDALVRRLRDRLAETDEHEFVVTVRGHGFRLDNPSSS